MPIEIQQAAWKHVADDLRSRIVSGELRPGDRLPSEQQILEETGVSRTSIRQAIGQLRVEGLVGTTTVGHMVLSAETVRLAAGDVATVNEAGATVLRRADGTVSVLPAGTRICG
jgi:DNA-binding GntR family transcriptional regulator